MSANRTNALASQHGPTIGSGTDNSLPGLAGVLACRDSDTESRNFSPVFLEGGGVVDLAITAMDQGWCMQAYTCMQRLRYDVNVQVLMHGPTARQCTALNHHTLSEAVSQGSSCRHFCS